MTSPTLADQIDKEALKKLQEVGDLVDEQGKPKAGVSKKRRIAGFYTAEELAAMLTVDSRYKARGLRRPKRG